MEPLEREAGYDGHPEQSSLRNAGMYQAEGNSAISPRGMASYESNLCSGIFQQLEKALNNIAKNSFIPISNAANGIQANVCSFFLSILGAP